MGNELLFELVVVIIEIAAFVLYLSVGAVMLEVVVPWIVRILKNVTLKLATIRVRLRTGTKTMKRTQGA